MQNSFPELAARDVVDEARSLLDEQGTDAAAERVGARRLHRNSAEYPAAFDDLPNPPSELWIRGTMAVAELPAVAIVGTRNATSYGLRVTRALATACARAGVCVVSGLARGIDGAAHQAALDAGGRTVAVLGTGVDCYFPRGHRTLQERIAKDGLLLSEHAPGSTGHGGSFPMRNRLIAALAQVVVVVEAPHKSGALNTANHARVIARRVAAVPGPIDSPMSAGSNELLMRPDTTPLLSADALLSMFSLDASPPLLPELGDDAALCWDALQHGATTIRDIVERTSLSSRACASAISALELDGLVTVDVGGRIRATLAVTG